LDDRAVDQREIARRCKVDHKTVGRFREEIAPKVTGEIPSETRTYTTKHGTVAKMHRRDPARSRRLSDTSRRSRQS
jgi:hypothetical protein